MLIDALIKEGQRDALRPWYPQTTGLLVAIVLAAVVGFMLDALAG